MTEWRMRIAYWIPKVTNAHSKYVIGIDFALQQWFHERASLLRYSTLLVLLNLWPQDFSSALHDKLPV
jgi:hypothetical protein